MSRPSGTTRTIPIVTAGSVGVASAQLLAANAARTAMILHNPSATATVSITTLTQGAATLNGAGTLTFGPLATILLTDLRVTDGFNAIASGAASPFTIWEF